MSAHAIHRAGHLTGQRNRRTMLDLIRRRAIDVTDILTHRYPAAVLFERGKMD